MMQRLFVDMDGTLAVFQPVDKLETLYEQGYFFDLKPNSNVVNAIRDIASRHQVEVFILSSVLSDSEYALDEKNAWLDKYLPEITRDHRIFPPCGQDKKDYIPDGIRRSDYLLDDYTANLILWQPPARGIKLLNGINHSSGTWKYDRIRYDKPAATIEDDILSVMQGELHIFDNKPLCKISDEPHSHEREERER
jgi:5'(3')-deoxyribonucleotidase